MREIVLREVPDRGWLPIIREQNDFDEWRETGRGSFYAVTGEALDAAERMLDERDIIADQAVPCNYKHEDLGTDEPCPDCKKIIYTSVADLSQQTRDAWKVQPKLDGWRPKLPLDIDKFNIPEGKG